jgi:hypothetical protein
MPYRAMSWLSDGVLLFHKFQGSLLALFLASYFPWLVKLVWCLGTSGSFFVSVAFHSGDGVARGGSCYRRGG